jgi:hypothetical protein
MISTQNIAIEAAPANDVFYIETSLPTGITITDYRRLRPRRTSLWKRLARRPA